MKPRNKPASAFTLVELMIVITIVGLLLAMTIPAFQRIRSGESPKRVGAVELSSSTQLLA